MYLSSKVVISTTFTVLIMAMIIWPSPHQFCQPKPQVSSAPRRLLSTVQSSRIPTLSLPDILSRDRYLTQALPPSVSRSRSKRPIPCLSHLISLVRILGHRNTSAFRLNTPQRGNSSHTVSANSLRVVAMILGHQGVPVSGLLELRSGTYMRWTVFSVLVRVECVLISIAAVALHLRDLIWILVWTGI